MSESEGLSEEQAAVASRLIDHVPEDGSPISNARLRERSGLAPEAYSRAVKALRDMGLVRSGKGRGGTLSRTFGAAGAPSVDGPKDKKAPKRASAKKAADQPLGFEETLWKAADKLRGSMDSSEYKHVVLGLVFLKYIDDAFGERRERLAADLASEAITGNAAKELLESRDEYTAEGVFWVPLEARWDYLSASAKQAEIGKLIDAAMDAVEAENPSLLGVLPKNYARPSLDVRRLGELVDLIAGLGLGTVEHREKDLLGRVYEYFLGRFASQEGRGGGSSTRPAASSSCWWR